MTPAEQRAIEGAQGRLWAHVMELMTDCGVAQISEGRGHYSPGGAFGERGTEWPLPQQPHELSRRKPVEKQA